MTWVGYPPACVGKGDAEGFDYCVQVFGRVMLFGSEGWDGAGAFEGFDYPESHQGYDALAVGRVFPDLHAMVVFVGALAGYSVDEFGGGFGVALAFEDVGDGIYGLAARFHVVLQVIKVEKSAPVFGGFDDCFCNSAGVKAFLAFLCEGFECCCEIGILEDFSWLRTTVAFRCVWICLEHLSVVWGCFEDVFCPVSPLELHVRPQVFKTRRM
jgi:hypothetical protein